MALGLRAARIEMGTILVVDDEPAVLNLVTTILDREGYRVQSASPAQEALDLFQEQADTIALVLTDLTMQRKNGIDPMRKLKAIRPELEFIVMSGDFQQWKEDMNGTSRISKPFTIGTLLQAVEKQSKDWHTSSES